MMMNKFKKIAAFLIWAGFMILPVVAYAETPSATVQDWYKIRDAGGNKYTYTDPNTGEVTEYVKGSWGEETVSKGALEGCPPVGLEVAKSSDCLFCPLFGVLYGAANEMSTLSFEKLGKSIAKVMIIGFALFIAFKTLMHISSLTKQDAPKFLGEILTMTFKIGVCYILLTNSKQIYDYFIVPVLGAGLEFGSAMLFENPDKFKECASTINIANDTALLPVTLFAKLDCFIRAIQSEIAVSQAIGSSLICVGRNEASNAIGIWDFGMVFQGLIIWGFAIMLSLSFAFYLIDATVMLGIVGALMPFLIASWPFKVTSSYTKKGLEMFLNTFFVYVFMGIVVSVNMQLIGQAITGGQTVESISKPGDEETTVKNESSGGGFAELTEALNGDKVEKLRELTDIGFGGFLILLCCCIFGFKFTSQATALAEKMSGGGGVGIGSQIGGMAAGGAAALAKKASAPARKAVSNKANELTSKAGNAIGKKLGLGKNGGKTGGNTGGKPPAANNAGGGDGGGSSGGGSSGGGSNNEGGDKGNTNNTKKNPNKGKKGAENLARHRKARKKKNARK